MDVHGNRLVVRIERNEDSRFCGKEMNKRLFKLLLFLFCLAGCCYQISKFLDIYLKYPVSIDVQLVVKDSVEPFSFSFCHQNTVQRTTYCKHFPERCHAPYNTTEFCDKFPVVCEVKNMSDPLNLMIPKGEPNGTDQKFYRMFGPKPDKLIEKCQYFSVDKIVICRKDIITLLSDDNFDPHLCHIMHSNVIKQVPIPPFALGTGTLPAFGTTFIFEPEENYYPEQSSKGRMLVHSPYIITSPSFKGKFIYPGKLYSGYISFVGRELLPAPYKTMCVDYLERKKMQNNSLALEWENCISECLMKIQLEKCGCIERHIYFPHNEKFCQEEDKDCISEIKHKCHWKCPRACKSLEYNINIEEKDLPEPYFDVLRKNFFPGKSNSYIKKRASGLMLYVQRPEVLVYTYSPKYAAIEIFSYFGGYIGIWLGVSLFNIYETLDWFATFIKSKKFFQKKQFTDLNKKRSPIKTLF